MVENVLFLKMIHDKINTYDVLLSIEDQNESILLKQDFQEKFIPLCINFITEYDRLIAKNAD
jgi:hypothetical protein